VGNLTGGLFGGANESMHRCGRRYDFVESTPDNPFTQVLCGHLGVMGRYVTLREVAPRLAGWMFLSEVVVLSLAAPPPTSHTSQRPLQSRTAALIAQDVNDRFRDGRPADELADAGVLVHMFDGGESSAIPWQMSALSDHVSASLINRRNPHLFDLNTDAPPGAKVGIVLAPDTPLICLYAVDSGTLQATNRGCGDTTCNLSAGKTDACSWRADNLKSMLEVQPWFAYNEVLISTIYWDHTLPHIIEAFMFIDDATGTHARASDVHRQFVQQYARTPAENVPLLRFTGHAFELV